MTKEEAINILQKVVDWKHDSLRGHPEMRYIAEAVEVILSQPSLPSNLDEAAAEYAYRGIPDIMKPTFKPLADEVAKYFKAGAEWMAGQGVRALASVGYYNQCGLSILTEPSIKKLGFKEGDELEITLRKK